MIAVIVGCTGGGLCCILLACLLYFCHYKPIREERLKDTDQSPIMLQAEEYNRPVC